MIKVQWLSKHFIECILILLLQKEWNFCSWYGMILFFVVSYFIFVYTNLTSWQEYEIFFHIYDVLFSLVFCCLQVQPKRLKPKGVRVWIKDHSFKAKILDLVSHRQNSNCRYQTWFIKQSKDSKRNQEIIEHAMHVVLHENGFFIVDMKRKRKRKP